ncbi:hypothetical protein KBY96_12970 [Cyanobium sp. ATX 6A2]|uniref:acyltransferase n=1 Tax=Cyanobium sp. ATX 6A2 TaxID=2823700 RepID=UPI0020CF1346|nr:hypothetical protein [Cyanobium sp. ATX 6A2]MCP9888837.1 hypothetical protein [Cyanobium sp. ATX 6A2]
MIQGLTVQADASNRLKISPSARFEGSRIMISGHGCNVSVGSARIYRGLLIHLDGNHKHVEIGDTDDHIINLKVLSQRGEGQSAVIGTGLRCNGMEIQMTDGNAAFRMGNDCMASWGVKIRTSDGHAIIDIASGKAINIPQDVVIGDRVWLCEDIKILKGVLIPSDTIIASGSVIARPFGPEDSCSVIGGCPGRVLKRGVRWDKRSPSEINALV